MAHLTAPGDRRRVLLALALALVLVVSAACGSGDDDASGGASASISTTTATSGTSSGTSSTSSTSSSTTSTKKRQNVIAWILNLGAGSPPGPATAEFAAYEALRQQDCASALTLATTTGQVFSVIEAAAKACLAAGSGDQALWREATRQRDDLRDADLNCLEVGVFGLLDRLVAAHEADPDRPFTFKPGGGEGTPPCPRVSGVEPASGPSGEIVTIRGDNLQFVTLVIVDFGNGNHTCFEAFDDPSPSVQMPAPPDGVTSARVIVAAAPAQWEMGSASFTYEEPAPTTTETSSTGTPDIIGAATGAGDVALPADCP